MRWATWEGVAATGRGQILCPSVTWSPRSPHLDQKEHFVGVGVGDVLAALAQLLRGAQVALPDLIF